MLLLLANSLGLADAASLAFDAASLSLDVDTASLTFDAWAAHHHRVYTTPAERTLRRTAFEANLATLDALSARSPLASYAPDAFADYTAAELRSLRGGASEAPPSAERIAKPTAAALRAALSSPIDWRARGAVTTPTSQGRCATCAYFAGIAAAEGAWKIAGHPLVKLSEQQEIDCYNNGGYALPNIAKYGVARAVDAPLANHSDPTITGCRGVTNCTDAASKAFATIDGLRTPASHNDTDILPMLADGPMAVSVDAGPYNGYGGGILNCSASPPYHHVDHANALVGYGVEPPPQPCASQPANKSYATLCETAWTGRAWWKPSTSAAKSVDECCGRCAAIVGNGSWNDPACGAAVYDAAAGTCSLKATAATGHALAGMPKPQAGATTCIPLGRTPVPSAGLAYWVLKNSWGPAFGEGGYARLLFGNNCLRGVTQPYLNKSGVVEAEK